MSARAAVFVVLLLARPAFADPTPERPPDRPVPVVPPSPAPTTADHPNPAPSTDPTTADTVPGTTQAAPGELPKKSHLSDPVDAPATPWYSGPYAHNRFTHIAVTGVLGLYYLSSYFLPTVPVPDHCRWCAPPSFDRSVRDHLIWTNTAQANTLSTIGAYAVAPAIGLALLILSDKNASATRLIDDLLPVAEAVAISGVVSSFGKWAFARERPYAYFGATPPPASDKEAYVGFWSGHSVLGFTLTTAAGTVAHFRGYWTEPYIWAAGITVSLGVEYFRIAADKHYLSDVLMGGFVGIAAGALVPRLMRRDIKIAPMTNGLAVSGLF